jgi:hypothetical protein
VLTDRGTYDYLASGTDPAGSIPNLSILTRDDTASAPGGQYALVNYFHGYIINPSKPGQTVNLPAAQDFLNLITSPAIQSQLASYLAHTGDPGGAPFKADASPLITTKKPLPKKYTASKPATLTGSVANAQPGYPAPNGIRVTVNRVVGSVSIPVASAKTNKKGAFTLTFTPPATGRYTLSTPQFGQIENATLNPQYGDLLSPAVTTARTVTVRAALTQLRAKSIGGRALVLGAVSPGTGHVKGKTTLYARRAGSKGGYHKLGTFGQADADGRFVHELTLAPGRWQIKATFADPTTVSAAKARTTIVTVKPRAAGRITAHGSLSGNGRLTEHVHISPAAVQGAKVSLVVVKLSGGGTARAHVVRTVHPKAGARTVTLHGTLKRIGHWALLAKYAVPGRATIWTRGVAHAKIAARKTKK